jgi:hypothetical protein
MNANIIFLKQAYICGVSTAHASRFVKLTNALATLIILGQEIQLSSPAELSSDGIAC